MRSVGNDGMGNVGPGNVGNSRMEYVGNCGNILVDPQDRASFTVDDAIMM